MIKLSTNSLLFDNVFYNSVLLSIISLVDLLRMTLYCWSFSLKFWLISRKCYLTLSCWIVKQTCFHQFFTAGRPAILFSSFQTTVWLDPRSSITCQSSWYSQILLKRLTTVECKVPLPLFCLRYGTDIPEKITFFYLWSLLLETLVKNENNSRTLGGD